MAEDLWDLGQPVTEATLVLNIICGLNECFSALSLHLRRSNPLPTFLQVRDDLRLEELTMAKAPPATALATLSGPTTGSSGGSRLPASTPSLQQPSAPKSPQQATSDSGGGGSQRGKRGGKRHNKGGGNSGGNGSSSSSGTPTSGGTGGPGPGWPSYHNPWAGCIYMWPGQRAPAPPRSAGPIQQPQAYFAGPG